MAAGPVRRRSLGALLMHPAAKPVLFLLALLPFAWLFYGAEIGRAHV